MAIGYGVPVPKGKTRKQQKAKRDREDANQLKAFRDAVWRREEDAMIGYEAHVPNIVQAMARCQNCGAIVRRGPGIILTGEVHHRIGRRHKATRYDPDNGILLCRGCHNDAHRREF